MVKAGVLVAVIDTTQGEGAVGYLKAHARSPIQTRHLIC